MTVKLLMDWPDSRNGRQYVAGNLVTTDAGTETGLVAAKMADSTLTGGTTYVEATPSFAIAAADKKTRARFQKARPLMIVDGSYTFASDNSTVAVTNGQTFTHPQNSGIKFSCADCTPSSSSGRIRVTSMTPFQLEDTVTLAIYSTALPASGFSFEVVFSSDGFATKSIKYGFSGAASQTWYRNGVTYMTVGVNEDGTIKNGGISSSAWTSVGGQLVTDTFNSVQIGFNSLSGIATKILGVWTNKKSTGKILFGFDDGLLSQYTEGFAYMRQKGIRGTIALPHGLIATTGYCSQAQLDEIYAEGWDFVGHSTNHLDLTAQTAQVVLSEVRQNKRYIDGRYPRGGDCMVYPENKYNAAVTAACRRSGWRFMRSDARRYMSIDAFGQDNYDAIGSQTLSSMTVAQIKDCILSAANTGQALWLYGHNILSTNNPAGTGGTPPVSPTTDYYRDDFRAIIDYIVDLQSQGLVECVTWSELQSHLDLPQQVYA